MEERPEFDAPEQIDFRLDEAIEPLAALEDARDVLIETDHLAVLVQVEHQIQLISHRLGFEQGGSDVR
jgi:hypothetical protein